MAVDVALQAPLFLAPLPRHLVEEIAADLAVKLVDIHRADPLSEPPMLGLEPLDRRLVFLAFVRMAGVQRLAHPLQNLIVEPKLAKHGGKMLLQNLLAHILAAAGGGLAPAFVGVSSAVVVDMLLFLDLTDHRPPTTEQPHRPQAISPEKAKSWVMRRCLLAFRPSITPCTRSHASTETSGSCLP